jgi:hypothetical protein
MQKTLLSVGVLALFGAMALPASAQMCGPGQQAQTSSATSGGMMCGAPMAADDPMADKPSQKPQASGMCPCCRNMAMMKGGKPGGMQHDMPGMDMK